MNGKYDLINDLKLVQNASGVKASVDSLLLARFLRPSPGWRIADLGCGNGVVGLLLARENPHCTVVGVELQAELVGQAREGARLNDLPNVHLVRADIRRPPWAMERPRFDLVLANPPYRSPGSGRLSPDPLRAAARHELNGDASDFARAASSLLRDGGSSVWIYLAGRKGFLERSLREAGMTLFRYRFVVSREGKDPSLVLMEALKGEGLGKVYEEEPLVIYKGGKGRDYTEEAREIIYG